jgi:hypothetical protein
VRDKLSRNRWTHPAFDTQLFTQQLESGLAEIHRKHWLGEPTADIYIDELPAAAAA